MFYLVASACFVPHPPFSLDSDKEAYFSRLRLNYLSLRFYVQEARQNRRFVLEIEVFEQVLE